MFFDRLKKKLSKKKIAFVDFSWRMHLSRHSKKVSQNYRRNFSKKRVLADLENLTKIDRPRRLKFPSITRRKFLKITEMFSEERPLECTCLQFAPKE